MPVYRVKCRICDKAWEIFRRMSDYDRLPWCECGGITARQICAPAIHADITPYVSPGTGKVIGSRAQQREDLLKSNSVINEPGLSRDIARRKVEVEEKSFAPVAAGIDSIVRDLVSCNQIES